VIIKINDFANKNVPTSFSLIQLLLYYSTTGTAILLINSSYSCRYITTARTTTALNNVQWHNGTYFSHCQPRWVLSSASLQESMCPKSVQRCIYRCLEFSLHRFRSHRKTWEQLSCWSTCSSQSPENNTRDLNANYATVQITLNLLFFVGSRVHFTHSFHNYWT